VQEKANERYYSGLYSSKFHPKASKFYRQEYNTLATLTRQETKFGSHGKIGKTETNTPKTKKRMTGSWRGERGKVLRGLGEDGQRRRRRIWRACFGRIPKLLFELHIPDYPLSLYIYTLSLSIYIVICI
jgi:hypothetical protein